MGLAWLVDILQREWAGQHPCIGTSAESGLADIKGGRIEHHPRFLTLTFAILLLGLQWASDAGCFIFCNMHPFAMQPRVPDGHDFP